MNKPTLIHHFFSVSASDQKSTQIIHKGVLFYRHYIKKDKIHWRCNKINTIRCPARLTTDPSGVTEINLHNHDI